MNDAEKIRLRRLAEAWREKAHRISQNYPDCEAARVAIAAFNTCAEELEEAAR